MSAYDQNAFMGDSSKPKFFVFRGVRVPLRDVILGVVIGVLAVLVVSLGISLAVVARRGSTASPPATSASLCTSSSCLSYAGSLRHHMNLSVDPCDDFYDYACSGYAHEHPIHPEHNYKSTVVDLLRANEQRLHVELWRDVQRHDSSSWERKVKTYFRSCMDDFSVQRLGGRPLVDAINMAGGWCVVRPGEPAQGSTWGDYGKQLSEIQVKSRSWAFFRVEVIDSPDNSKTNMVKLCMDGLGMDYREYSSKVELVQLAYMTYMRTVGMLVSRDAGMNLSDTSQQTSYHVDRFAQEVYDLEKELANATALGYNGKKSNEIMTLDNLNIVSSKIDWKGILTTMFPEVTFVGSTRVMLDYTSYFGQLDHIISRVLRRRSSGARAMNNYLMWRLMQSYVPILSLDYRSAAHDLQVAVDGRPETRSLWQRCFRDLSNKLPLGMSALYLRTLTSMDTSNYVQRELLPAMRRAFDRKLASIAWMDESTKARATEKVNKMKKVIGYSEAWHSDSAVDAAYAQLTVKHERLAENTISWWYYSRKADGKRLAGPATQARVDIEQQWNPDFDFSHRWNTLIVPAGILQTPLVDPTLPVSVNTGGLGSALGRAVLGAVDIIGGHYAPDGTVTHWWSPSTMRNYMGCWGCFIDFWNGTETGPFLVDGRKRSVKVQGTRFGRYAMADAGGLKHAYSAYKDSIAKQDSPKRLPGFSDTSDDQHFFLAFAQSHCFLQRQKDAYNDATRGQVPRNLRVNGALKQFKEFGRAYKCPANSNMAKSKICDGY